jgi:hypothetical protein
MKIYFKKTIEASSDSFAPQPAFKNIPEWYKNTNPYLDDTKIPRLVNGGVSSRSTIKKCMPVFDMISSGYILFTPTDIWVTQEKTETGTQPVYTWPSWTGLGFHPIEQAPDLPYNSGHTIQYPKWINPWSIKTSPGCSVMIISPTYRDSIFTILPGVVDTDKYFSNINFPFVLNNINFEGLIPAGTPIAQIIPFKREDWQMEFGNDQQFFDANTHYKNITSVFYNGYKKIFRQDKTYK